MDSIWHVTLVDVVELHGMKSNRIDSSDGGVVFMLFKMFKFPITQFTLLCLLSLTLLQSVWCQPEEPSFILSKVDVSISASEVRRLSQSINYPQSLTTPLTVHPDERLRVSFNLKQKTSEGEKPVRAHQAFALFTHITGAQTVKKLDSTKSGKYKLLLDATKGKAKSFFNTPGEYQLDILLGTFSIPDALKYRIGEVHFDLTPPKETEESEHKATFGPRPEIHHIFRKAEELPPQWLSSLFTLIVLSPWVWLFISWSSLGVNVSNFPINSPTEMFPAIGFLGSLASTGYLYYRYWTDLNIFDTLWYLLILSLISVITGRKVLRDISKRRSLTK
ncbi:hypothetical protein K7432_000186 [Basidiobolus ranarum]|uniref:Ribophorin II n=1 Tax=Basidiobolus ranarum TaxID=34480 RepID=A0ABR2X4Y9_9FUNG